MRQIRFDGDSEHEQKLFASMVTVFWNSAPAQSFEQLAIASALKKKLNAISDAIDGNEFQRKIKEGSQDFPLRNTEWDYLKEHLTPPSARWPNIIADDALEILEKVKEAETVPDPQKVEARA